MTRGGGAPARRRPAVRLRRPAQPAPVRLDDNQAAVVHRVAAPGHGPLLLLAGPGTGKTTTIVEAVAARVQAGTPPDSVLVLTFSRKAAQELRARLTARLIAVAAEPMAWTFHAFGYRLLCQRRAEQTMPGASGPLLLNGPEQDVMVRDLLAASRVTWPPTVLPALHTRGFVDELRAAMSAMGSLGLEPEHLRVTGRADWAAVADFVDEYVDVQALSGQTDYAELVTQAVEYASNKGQTTLRKRYSLVLVDEYQDTDPAQRQLLQGLAGDGRDLLVVGDPDQSIYGFRGAEVRNLLDFQTHFPAADNNAVGDRVLTLAVSRRCARSVLATSRLVADRMRLSGLSAVAIEQHRDLRAADDAPDGEVEVHVHPSAHAESGHIVDIIRREHLHRGTPWSQMAVLVRTGSAIPGLRRALVTGGVPVEVAADEVPLAADPSVAPLLLALHAVADDRALTPTTIRTLLLSPLVGTDPIRLRRLGRDLRARDRRAAEAAGLPPLPRGADVLVAEAVSDPTKLDDVSLRLTSPVLRLVRLLNAGRDVAERGGTAYDVLWQLWSGSSWARRLEEQAWGPQPAARAAHRDCDAVGALFHAASRTEERVGRAGVSTFLAEVEAQQIPADSLAERGNRPDAVRVLTVHRAKGLEWDVVVVPGVQEEVWPNLRRRGTLLDVEELDQLAGGRPPPSIRERMAEERRIFYVALTRARRRLVVSAVSSGEREGLRPSRFVLDLLPDNAGSAQPGADSTDAVTPSATPPEPAARLARRSLTPAALVAELRRTLLDPHATAVLHLAAADRLAALSAEDVPGADPHEWWGQRALTCAPAEDPPATIKLSGSSLDKLVSCPLAWFLEHEAGGTTARNTAMGFGSVLHALAEMADDESDLKALDDRLSTVWSQLGFAARWQSQREREEATSALRRLLHWVTSARGRRRVGAERRFTLALTVPTSRGDREVLVRGYVDRLEVDDEGEVWVVDFKTSRSPPPRSAVRDHVQLRVYQRAMLGGAFSDVVGVDAVPGGAQLVHLRHDEKDGEGPRTDTQERLLVNDDGRTSIDAEIERAVEVIATEQFAPRPSARCQRCAFHPVCPLQSPGRQVVS